MLQGVKNRSKMLITIHLAYILFHRDAGDL
jgi:hypothetical protein